MLYRCDFVLHSCCHAHYGEGDRGTFSNKCHAFISLFEKVVLGNGNAISLVQMQDTVLLYRVSPLLLEIPGYLVRGT